MTSAELTNAALTEQYQDHLLGVFGTPQRVLSKGKGAKVWDADGNKYLDLLAGIAVNALGHAHPRWVKAVSDQAATLAHVSNFFASEPQIALATKILELAKAPEGSRVFFTNSGTEANEAAFKLARRNAGTEEKPRTRILALENSFHGRTMGALALTWKEAYRAPFEPLPGGVEFIPAGDIDALTAALDDTVQAVFIEPIQGEAGVVELPEGYLEAARELTTAASALLIVDEVQTGIGRTGQWFASSNIVPDAMTLAKGLGGGFPIGALVTFGETNSHLLSAGQHGTTFGGNPLASAAALATLTVIEDDNLIDHAQQLGKWITAQLEQLDFVTDVHGRGLLIGFDLDVDTSAAVVTAALEHGFIVNAPTPKTIRLAPPLVLTQEEAQTFIDELPMIYRRATANLSAPSASKK
ncbi:acetylornithine transaminase [Neomicrococcus aestuarii]|uniref:Acetylornithine aminotransferase n=1 Tax=Neomicrococcus aestuarii TaxID=556325 RepID=A0A1L2ZM47_9MICC|nr:acetylornithine transaminase [Neomicrococcus aestuarii]APF40280.1 acetylornithine transaminase [Neomicrococcus aestuarii]